jgi:hypothetical protein
MRFNAFAIIFSLGLWILKWWFDHDVRSKLEIIRRYDLDHADNPADIARSARFLINPSGTIRWRMVTEDLSARTRGPGSRSSKGAALREIIGLPDRRITTPLQLALQLLTNSPKTL